MSTIPDWNTELNTNRLIKTYVNEFIDISGNLVIRENTNLHVTGNIDTKGNVSIADSTFSTDVNLNHRLYVGGDASINSNVTINGNNSLGGTITSCQIAAASIPVAAFNGSVPSPSPDYSQPTIIYENDVNVTADISMNGSTVQATNIKVDGNIQFSDGTILDSYSNHLDTVFNQPYSSFTINSASIPSTYGAAIVSVMRCSYDGKYIIVAFGADSGNPYSYQAGLNNIGKSGVFISTDYGTTYTLVTLPTIRSPNSTNNIDNDFTSVNFSCVGISMSGKNMIIGTTGTKTTEFTDTAYAYSLDYGKTWTSTAVISMLGKVITVGETILSYNYGEQLIVQGCAIDDYGRIALHLVKTGSTTTANSGIYYSSDRMQFRHHGFTPDYPHRIFIYNDEVVATYYNTYFKITFAGVARSVSLPGTNGYYRVTHSSNKNGICAIITNGWVANDTNKIRFCLFVNDINNVLSTTNYESTLKALGTTAQQTAFLTTTYQVLGSVSSFSGKYIIIGASEYGRNGEHVNIGVSTQHIYYSEDYGATFSVRNNLYVTTITSKHTAITYNGYVFAQQLNGRTFERVIFTKFKASTFTNLSVINTLKVGANQYTSDYRIKNDVTPLDATITIDHLRPVKYLQTLIHKQQYGLIAHELQSYFPDLVKGEKDGEQLQSVNYTGLIAILVNEIKRLKRELTELENQEQS